MEISICSIIFICNINLPILIIFLTPARFPEKDIIEVLNNIPLNYDEELSNIIKFSNN